MTLPGPIITKASGGVMAEIGKEAPCERGPASQGDCAAKGADRRDEIQENPMTALTEAERVRKAELAEDAARIVDRSELFGRIEIRDLLQEYADRLRSPVSAPVSDVNAELVAALRHALKLLEPFDDHGLSLGLGSNALAPIRAALSKAEAESAGEKKCACGAMSEQDCHDLPSLRHCGGAEATIVPTDEMVRAAGDVLLGRVNAPEQEIYKAAREALTAALAAMPGGVDWNAMARAAQRIGAKGTEEEIEQVLLEASRLTPSAIGAEGWMLVPIKPTAEMVTAMGDVMDAQDADSGVVCWYTVGEDVWKAAMKAAPTPPTAQENDNG